MVKVGRRRAGLEAGAGGFPSTQVPMGAVSSPVSRPEWRSGVDAAQCPVAVSELQAAASAS